MKNFSTIGARLVIPTLLATLGGGLGLASLPGLAMAQDVPPSGRVCAFKADAPDQHVVVKRDTLWDISGKFLEHPWCWGQVWNLNREEIRNPHWIYPGQIIYFDRKNGRLSLSAPGQGGDGSGLPVTRLSPKIRVDGVGRDAIASIPAHLIEPFLSQPLVIDEDELKSAPRIVASDDDHVFLGKGDKAYVRGDLKGVTDFQVFRPGKPLTDPQTKAVLGYEAFFLGTVKLRAAAKPGVDVSTVVVSSTKEEMGVGDQLVPLPQTPLVNYAPHVPEQQVDARVMSIYGGVNYAGQNQIISVNRGSLDGLDVGAVLQLYHFGRTVADTTSAGNGWGTKAALKLPDEQYGNLFIFRVFKHISYGLIMQVTEPAQVGDVAKTPE